MVIKLTIYFLDIVMHSLRLATINYIASFVYYRELAPGTISLTGDRVHVDVSKQNSYYALQAPPAGDKIAI